MIIVVSWREWLLDVRVDRAVDATVARSHIDTMSEDRTAYVLDTDVSDWLGRLDAEWRSYGTVKLAHIFNALAPDAPVKKFENRDVALRRIGIRLIEAACATPLIERAPDAIQDAHNVTQGEINMAREARIGEFKPIGKDTNIGRIVTAHKEGATSLQEIATLVGMNQDQVKVHLRAARGGHGIGHAIVKETGEVTLTIPDGVEIFKQPKEPKAAKEPRELKYGAFAQVRPGTLLGKIVAAAPASKEVLGAAADVTPDKVLFALRRARVTHGIEHSVAEDGTISVRAHAAPDGAALLKDPTAPRVAQTDGVPRQGKNAKLDAEAAAGTMPEKPIVTSATNMHRQKHFDELARYAEAGEWDKVAAKHMKGIDSYSGMINRYRDRLLAAHAAQMAHAAE